MTAQDLAAIVKGVAPAVLHVVSSAVAPLALKVASLESRIDSIRDGRDGAAGRDGKDADPVDVDSLAQKAAALVPAPDLDAIASKAAELIPTPKDGEKGKDADPVDIEAIARKAADLIPVPKDGKDGEAPDVEEVAKVAALLVPKAKDGEPGKDADPSLVLELKSEIVALREQLAASEVRSADFVKEMREWLSTEIVKAVAEIPTPKDGADGASVDPAEVEAMVAKVVAAIPPPKDGERGPEGTPGLNGKDGIGLAGLLINKDGHLVGTLSDGSMHELGLVVGRDGEKGADGLQGAQGANGINGKDGTLENLKIVRIDERTIEFQLKDGTPVEGGLVRLNHPVFEGTYVEGTPYQKDALVQWDGSGWIALVDNPPMKPGTGKPEVTGWKLWIKRGNDGKPGTKGLDGKDGKPGPPGRDGTRSY